ncbi:U3 small nucleolar RNA-interacting protein 2 [Anas platyrhynchos]|uniref:U3 small nucleolar RNA-interacting protein 2 n=1 Tax=Anas zonorhyncha TaxID=75864 RepID=A0A8B9ZLJ3_9AVES|eukprot:XP_027323533.1 U3 small nucleolar RNA-interacting protein 2 [Anas platyrhynchos]
MAAAGRKGQGAAAGRRRRPRGAGSGGKPRPAPARPRDEEVSSDSEAESLAEGQQQQQQQQQRRRRREEEEEEEEEEVEETPQEKKLRLAKLYLEQLRQHEEEQAEEEEEENAAFFRDPVGERLKEDVLEQKGRLQRLVAKEVQPPDPLSIRVLRGHQQPITCLVISPDDKFIFSAAKDGSIIKWEVESGKRLYVMPGGKKGTGQHMGHTAQVLCMAISSDGKYLVTGDRNKLILVWEAATCKRLHTFTGHRDAVSGLSFQKGTHQLYSASHDRSVKVWNVAENAYVETLFGHQDVITGLDSLSRECCVTSGGRDGTVRVWKIPEESQLIFYGHQGSIDCIQLINEEHMVSGADDGSVALWGLTKKKPLALVRQSHGTQGENDLQQPYWVSAVAALRNSDLVATGSHSGSVKLWKCGEGFRKLEPLCDIPLVGFINSLKFSATGDFLVAGVGQEHRLGRWWRAKEAKNSICIIPLKRGAAAPSSGAADRAWPGELQELAH